jgi:hypothetical protein
MNPIAIAAIAVIIFLILAYIIYSRNKSQVSSKKEQPVETSSKKVVVEQPIEPSSKKVVVEQPIEPSVKTVVVEQPIEPSVKTVVVEESKSVTEQQCPDNDLSNYIMDDTLIKGQDSLQRIAFHISNFMHRIRENFALTPETATNKTSLVYTTLYNRATLKSGISNTVNGPLNGGQTCAPYPSTIYIPAAAPPPASSCVGSACTIDGQLCLPGSVGAGDNLYRCVNRVWVQQSSPNDPFSADRGLVGLYEVDSFDGVNWKDKSGLGNHATVVNTVTKVTLPIGNGSSKSFVTLSGRPGTGIIFPTTILPSTYTLFTVARYSGARAGRIFDGIGNNWLSGFWNRQTRVAYHTDSWMTNAWNGFSSNWVLSSDTNDGYWGNGEYLVTDPNSGKLNTRLTINQGDYNGIEPSDWQVAYVAVFNRKLTNAERVFVEAKLASQFGLTITPCPAEQTRDSGGICQWNPCPAEQTRINGVCQSCPAEQTLVNGICQWNPCPAEQTRDSGGICQWNPCPVEQTRDSGGVCQWIPCPAEQTRVNGVCQWIPCPAEQTRINGWCQPNACPAEQTRVNGVCQWNPCPAEQTRDSGGDCRWNPCPAEQTRINDVCQWNPCPTGKKRYSDGKCIIDCGINGYNKYEYGTSLDECWCSYGYSSNGSSCVFTGCPEGTYWDSICGMCMWNFFPPGYC